MSQALSISRTLYIIAILVDYYPPGDSKQRWKERTSASQLPLLVVPPDPPFGLFNGYPNYQADSLDGSCNVSHRADWRLWP